MLVTVSLVLIIGSWWRNVFRLVFQEMNLIHTFYLISVLGFINFLFYVKTVL
jgi:hypothetical protein